MRTRSERRAFRRRAIAKARHMLRHVWWGMDDDEVDHRAPRYADNLKKCSCWMCRNRRQDEGPSISERKRSAKGGDDGK